MSFIRRIRGGISRMREREKTSKSQERKEEKKRKEKRRKDEARSQNKERNTCSAFHGAASQEFRREGV